MLAHAFEMKFNRLADQILCLVQRFADYTKAGEVWNIRAPTC